MRNKHYYIEKNKVKYKTNLDVLKMKGFKVTPQNKYEYPGVEVKSMLLIKPSFIEKLLVKKTKRKLEYYLKYIINILDESDDDGDLRQALNDLTRYKSIVRHKYKKFLDDKYIDLLTKKISMLERELKSKIVYKTMNNDESIKEERRKNR